MRQSNSISCILTGIIIIMLSSCSIMKSAPENPQRYHMISAVKQLKLGMDKDEVMQLMGEPYKIAFAKKGPNILEEELFYKTSIYVEKWFLITYKCSFENGRLSSLSQTETLYYQPSITTEK